MPIKQFKKHKYIVEGRGFKSIRQVARFYNIDQSTISRRMKTGFTLEEAIKPVIIDDKCKGTIYVIENSINNKVYIGLTTQDIRTRFSRHITDSKKGCNNKFYKALRKYGPNNFKIRSLARSNSKAKLIQLEIAYIKKYNSVNKGYNTDLGGKGLSEFAGKEIVFEGKVYKSITKLSEYLNIPRTALNYRIKNNLDLKTAVGKACPIAKKVKYRGIVYDSIADLSRHLNLHIATISSRLRKGYCLNGPYTMTGKKGYYTGQYQ